MTVTPIGPDSKHDPDLLACAAVGRQGLGHCLFSWAHALLWSHRHHAELLPSNWMQPRIGPWLRRERDKRMYFLLFRPPTAATVVRQARAWLVRPKLASSFDRQGGTRPQAGVLHVFRLGERLDTPAVFDPMIGQHALVHEALRRMTRSRLLPLAREAPFLAAHIRLGDFHRTNAGDLAAGRKNTSSPIDWFVHAIASARGALGEELPVRVFSDGSDEQIRPVLAMPRVERSMNASPITDMLDIAQARCLIASGSNFSLWGSYLGQVPRVFHPGQKIARVLIDDSLEVALAPGDGALPPSFVQALAPRYDVLRSV